MNRSILLLPALVLAACSGSPGPAAASRPGGSPAAARPTAAPPTAAQQLFVVLESSGGPTAQPDTIAIVGLDGVARAKAHFKARQVPWVGPDLFPLLPQVAHVAAGRAYYVDGDGAVRSIGPDGSMREETRFPVTGGQQEVSFAVSPDGHDLVGSVVTLPPEPNPPPTPGYQASTPYAMDVLTATSGSPAVVAYHRTWTNHDLLDAGAQFVAWDTGGPVATSPSFLGTQGGGPHQWNGVSLMHFPGGHPGAAVPTPAKCAPMDVLPTGALVCGGGSDLEVLRQDGSVVWRYAPTDPNSAPIYGFLSPDAQRVVAIGSVSTVYSASSPPVPLSARFSHTGWIDPGTVAGQVASGDFAYVSLASPDQVNDLGLKGQFVGGLLT